MKICVITDAGKEIGYGHYFRSKRIIEALNSKKDVKETWITRSRFISQKEKNTLLISETCNLRNNYKTQEIEAIIQATKYYNPNLVLVDSYSIQLSHEKELRIQLRETPIALICDSPLLKHAGDLIIDSNYYQDLARAEQIYQSNNLVNNAKYIIGPYSIPPKTDPLKSSNDTKQILIYWGSVDCEGHLLSRTLTAINKSSFFKKNSWQYKSVHIGDTRKLHELQNEFGRKNVLGFQEDLTKLIEKSRFFIGAGGSTIWDILYCNKPSIIMPTVENQKDCSERLGKNNLAINCKNIEEVCKHLEDKNVERTINRLREIASTLRSRVEFQDKNDVASAIIDFI